MTNPTSSFGWQMPTASDLVTDLPADFEVFGQAVDTDFAGLLGGTTGQVLAKASGTDLDFVWSADAAGMTNPMTTTADIIYSSSGSTPARLGIGSTDDVLTVAGGVPTWAAPAAAGIVSGNNFVSTAESTTSDSFVALTTSQAVTLTTGTKVLVLVGALIQNDTNANGAVMGFAISGATTRAAGFDTAAGAYEIPVTSTNNLIFSRHSYLTVTAGSNTFTAQFRRVFGGTATFEQRFITVIDMGS
jgi:hypothetical protein